MPAPVDWCGHRAVGLRHRRLIASNALHCSPDASSASKSLSIWHLASTQACWRLPPHHRPPRRRQARFRTTVPHNCAESVRWTPNDSKTCRLFRSMSAYPAGISGYHCFLGPSGQTGDREATTGRLSEEIHREIAGHVVPRYRGRSSPRYCWSSWTGSSCRDRRWDHPDDGANEDRRSRIAGLHLPIGPLDQRSRQSLRSGWLTGRRHDACCRRRRRPRPAAPSP